MDPLIIAIIFSIAVVGGTYFFAFRMSKSTVKNMNLRIQELAAEMGLPAPETATPALSAFYSAELSGKVDGRDFYFTNFTRSAKTSASYTTEFSWAISREEQSRVIFTKEGIKSTFRKQFGVQDVEIGNKDFDAKFLIKCDNPEYVKSLMSDSLVSEFLKKERIIYGTIIIHHQEVHYEEPGVLLTEEDLQRILRVIELCRMIAQVTEKKQF